LNRDYSKKFRKIKALKKFKLSMIIKMKVLIIGSGGREYAIALKISLQNPDTELFYIGSSR